MKLMRLFGYHIPVVIGDDYTDNDLYELPSSTMHPIYKDYQRDWDRLVPALLEKQDGKLVVQDKFRLGRKGLSYDPKNDSEILPHVLVTEDQQYGAVLLIVNAQGLTTDYEHTDEIPNLVTLGEMKYQAEQHVKFAKAMNNIGFNLSDMLLTPESLLIISSQQP